jgi:hypothetical protein
MLYDASKVRWALLTPAPFADGRLLHEFTLHSKSGRLPGNAPMIRFLLRFLGVLMLAVAFVSLVIDGTGWVANGILNSTQVGQLWFMVHQNSLLLLQPAVERHVAVWLWNPVITTVLEQPVWLVFGIIGAVLILLGRKKKPLIGYARE